ncbi:MAG TPA: site-specific tyrosine recombinase XerD, partial [Halieaceae bacterium]|nr:site-specific tyrosine recombinase XerD [Halieaceae bacterium]
MRAQPDSLDPAIEQYLDALWLEKGLSGNTLEAYRRDLGHYQQWLAGRKAGLLEADRVDLQAYLAARLGKGQSPRST